MPFTLQYVSDIHLEFHDTKNKGHIQPDMFVKPDASGQGYLALIGDIGIPQRAAMPVFLEWCSKNWKEVFWIPGNHEYYKDRNDGTKPLTYDEKNEYMKKLASQWPNIHFLHREVFDIEEYRILGCCLWSYLPPEFDKETRQRINDSFNIYVEGDLASPTDIRKWHETDTNWLSEQIELATVEGKKVIVLTHYLPSFNMIHEKYEGNPFNYAFATDLEHLIRPPVCAWLCGHSHTAVEYGINNVFCALNPYGYPGENSKEQINRSKVLYF